MASFRSLSFFQHLSYPSSTFSSFLSIILECCRVRLPFAGQISNQFESQTIHSSTHSSKFDLRSLDLHFGFRGRHAFQANQLDTITFTPVYDRMHPHFMMAIVNCQLCECILWCLSDLSHGFANFFIWSAISTQAAQLGPTNISSACRSQRMWRILAEPFEQLFIGRPAMGVWLRKRPCQY